MRTLITIGFIFFVNSAIAQESKNSIEISVLGRYDKHAEYDTRYDNRVRIDHTKLYGFSQGFNLSYRRKNKQGFYLKAGLGYYKLAIDKIRQTGFLNMTINSRNIDFVPRRADKVQYSTSHYYYNTLQFSAGLEKDFSLRKDFNLVLGADYLHYYTFSQKYFIADTYYKPHNNGSLGNGVIAQAGFTKQSKEYYFGPKIIIPIYQKLKTDKLFLEDVPSMIKWFNGVGISFTIGKYF